MITCAHCGRSNDPGSRFCMDCGKPLSASAMALPSPVAPGSPPATRVYATGATAGKAATGGGAAPGLTCSSCGHAVDATMPFCAFCGAKLEAAPAAASAVPSGACPNCGAAIASAEFKFCPNCATPLGKSGRTSAPHAATEVFSAKRATQPPVQLALTAEDGTKSARYPLAGDETTLGRNGADVNFA